MLKLDTNPVFEEAILTFGYGPQIRKSVEELAELTVAVLHFQDGKVDHEYVAQEIADVLIMCHQLARIVGESCVERAYANKTERLKAIIQEVRSGRTS